MNIPSAVRIDSMDYKVCISDKVLLCDVQRAYGHIDYERHIIEIDETLQDKQGQEQTFLHELVHGIISERNLDLEKADEETIVDEIAKGLHQVIRDNPGIFKVNEERRQIWYITI